MPGVPTLSTQKQFRGVRDILRSPLATTVMVLAIIALAIAYHVRVYGSIDKFTVALDNEHGLFIDFIRHYYPAALAIFQTGLPAKGFYYPAFFAVCLAPLGRLTLAHATHLWMAVQCVSAAMLLAMPAGRWLRERRGDFFLYVLLALLGVPLLHNFMWGQVSTGLTACVLGSLYLYRSGRRTPAAVLLALATAVKFYPVIFGVYFLFKREFRLLAIYAVSLLGFLVVVPAAILGPGGLVRYHQALSDGVREVRGASRTYMNSQYLPHVMERYASIGRAISQSLRKHPPHSLADLASETIPNTLERYQQLIALPKGSLWPLQAVSLAIFVANLLLLWRIVRTIPDSAEPAFALLFLSLPLLLETSWPHYFTCLPFCQVVLYRMIRQAGTPWPVCRRRYILLGLSVLLSSAVLFNLMGGCVAYSGLACLFWSNAWLLVLLYVQVLYKPRFSTSLNESISSTDTSPLKSRIGS